MTALNRLSKLIKNNRISDDNELRFAVSDLEFVERSLDEANRRLSKGEQSVGRSIAQLETYYSRVKELIAEFVGDKAKEEIVDEQVLVSKSFPLEMKANSNRNSSISIERINHECGRIRARLCLTEHVTWERVIEDLLVSMKLNCVEQLGLRRLRDIDVINNLIDVHRLVNVYLSAYRAIRAFGTLFDLGREIAEFLRVARFDDLYIGPLDKHPQVIDLFSIPPNLPSIVPITTERVLEYLDLLLEENKRIETRDLLEFIAQKENISSTNRLGIRINSVSLAISALRAAKQNERLNAHASNIVRKKIKMFWEEELERVKAALRTNQSFEHVQIDRYAKMTTWQFLTDLGFSCRTLIANNGDYEKIETLIELLKRNENLSRLFHVAVCQGRFGRKEDEDRKESRENEVLDYCREIGIEFGDADELLVAEKRVLQRFGVSDFSELVADKSFLRFGKKHFSPKVCSLGPVVSESSLVSVTEERRLDLTRLEAIDAVKSCRIMDEIGKATKWSKLYEYRFGDLRSFLVNIPVSDLVVLEASGNMIKLADRTCTFDDCENERDLVGHVLTLLCSDKSSVNTGILQAVVAFLKKSNNPIQTVLNCLRLLRLSPVGFDLISQSVFTRALTLVCPDINAKDEIEKRWNDHSTIDEGNCILEETAEQVHRVEIEYPRIFTNPKPKHFSPVRISNDFSPRDHIARIISSKFADGSSELCGMIGRSVKCLALDLYNSDFHFAHELVQNADDCEFRGDVEPSIEFEISDDSTVSVWYNETGFKESDVEAICDICNSSKQGLIGRKGIGFRSVFKVTDAPEIHSNGYHLRFDVTKNGSLGYIMPEWISGCSCSGGGTRLLIPLKKEFNGVGLLDGINARLLLFLRNISSIVVKNGDRVFEASKQVSTTDGRIVRLTERRGEVCSSEEWLVVKKASEDGSEVALAFPLFLEPTECDVYAFLPIKSYNFPFIIHADFDVTASRQDIHFSSKRTASLLNTLTSLYLEDLIPNLEAITGRQAHVYVCRHLPKPDVVSPAPLKTFAVQCIKGLSRLPLFPTTSSLISPDQCAYLRQPSLRRLLDNELVRNRFNKHLLDEDVCEANEPLVFKILGVREITLENLVDVLGSDEDNFGRYLMAIYRGLSLLSLDEETKLVSRLRSSKLYPVRTNSQKCRVSLDEKSVYFPVRSIEAPESLLDQFAIISETILINDDENSDEIECFLGRLGVEKLSENDLFLAALTKSCDRTLSEQCLTECVQFAFENWRQKRCDLSGILAKFKGRVMIRTVSNGFQSIDAVTLSDRDVSRLFPFACSHLIDCQIYQINSNNWSDWKSFLQSLGIGDLLRVSQTQTGDFICPDFQLMISMGYEACQLIFEHVCSNWSTLEHFLTHPNNDDSSSFLKTLKSTSWIPCQLNKTQLITRKPSQVFIRSVQFENSFGDNVAYLSKSNDVPRGMIRRLGLIEKMSETVVREVVHDWHTKGLNEAVPICMARLFANIFRLFPADQISTIFPYIWVHTSADNVVGCEESVHGCFVHHDELRWSPGGLDLIYPAKMSRDFVFAYGLDSALIDVPPEGVFSLVDSMARKRNHKMVSEHQSSSSHRRPNPDSVLPGLIKRVKLSSGSTRDTGRLGEQFVFKYLIDSNQSDLDQGNVQIIWVNEQDETGLPYDITIERAGKIVYIEVKSSADRECRSYFPISAAEIRHATDNPGMYDVYRVTGAGGSDPKLVIIRDLPRKLSRHEVDLFIGV